MANRAFTAASISAIKPPKSGRVEKFDGSVSGFGIRVTANGARSWIFLYSLGGKRRRYTIGSAVDISLADARAMAISLRDRVKAGEDPAADKQKAKSQVQAEAADRSGTVGAVWETYYKRHASKLARGWELEQIVNREVMPHWRDRRVTDITRYDVAELCGALIDAGKPGAANNLFSVLRGFFNFTLKQALVRGMETAPTDRMSMPAKAVHRDRILSDAEIKDVWKALDVSAAPFGAMFKTLLLTGQRRSETARMKWSDVDLDAGSWTIPASDTKTKAAHIVHLSPLVAEIIKAQPRVSWSEYVFAGRGANPVSGYSKAKARVDDLSGISDWVLHDLRRTCRSGLARLGVPVMVAERVLNHELGGLIGVYDRHGYDEEMKQAWKRWSDHIAGLIRPKSDKVVPIKRVAGSTDAQRVAG